MPKGVPVRLRVRVLFCYGVRLAAKDARFSLWRHGFESRTRYCQVVGAHVPRPARLFRIQPVKGSIPFVSTGWSVGILRGGAFLPRIRVAGPTVREGASHPTPSLTVGPATRMRD